ncbi:MAG: DEAD/DEAH box helicase family protein [Blastocatellia bacterium]
MKEQQLPIQPVERPILCSPFEEPDQYWFYKPDTGQMTKVPGRRKAGYFYKTESVATGQARLFAEENFDELTLVNLLREDVKRWREAGYRGASHVTKELLRHWADKDRHRRLFFCQREAVETIIYLAELRMPGKSAHTGFHNFHLSDDDLRRMLRGERPAFQTATSTDYFPTLVDRPANAGLLPLIRLGCKMATGSGKTVVMAMLIAWAFCNRAQNPQSAEFPNAVLVCCPNLTVKERLQVLRPEHAENYYAAFDLLPLKYRSLMQSGSVLVTNWHAFTPESEHKEGDRTYAVVNKGPETPTDFARRLLGEMYERMPLMVLNDEGHHCWRPAPQADAEELSGDERKEFEAELREATLWVDGLDRLNNAGRGGRPGVGLCVDVSATPFYIQGSGYPEGRPFPWLVCDFGLVDAIESGIVKIPRLPVQDTTGRPDPKYFRLWEAVKEGLKPAELMPGKSKKPRPEVVYREAQGALTQIAGQWVERFRYIEQATPGQERVPPVLIIVCDNTDIAQVFYEKISGEREEEVVTETEVDEVLAEEEGEDDAPRRKAKGGKPKKRTVYGPGEVFPEYFSNSPARKHTIRIDSKLLAEAESDDPNKKKQEAAEALRRIVATVGRPGQPGEHVRCVVSVSMLTEGWDANNVTHILGLRAFGSQLLCEQVVGRGLRRMDYTPVKDPTTGKELLAEEYVDVYGIPFSVIPFKGRPTSQKAPEDRPKQHVVALPERKHFEIRFPNVEGYAFALRKNVIRCNFDQLVPLKLEPSREPTATFLSPQVGYKEGVAVSQSSPFAYVEQNRERYYEQTHLQTIKFQIARLVMEQLLGYDGQPTDKRRAVLRLQSRHQLFPQVYSVVESYIHRKVDFQTCDPRELGLERYVRPLVERLRDAIEPDDAAGEAPLLPLLYRYKPMGTTADVDFKTTRPCFATQFSHINQVAADTGKWEQSAAFRLEQGCLRGLIRCYARNDGLQFRIPYEYLGVTRHYEPDFIVELSSGVRMVLEIKGYEDEETRAKHGAAQRWVSAVNNWGQAGRWAFHICRNPQTLESELAHIATGKG